jgi:predicted permease
MNRHDLTLRLRALIARNRADRDLAEELAFHIEMQSRKNAASGMSKEEAARRARIQFGGAAQVTEECRDARGIGLVETTWQDVRYAIRGYRRSPMLVLTVVATIGLGLGLDTALFTVFNATYFRPIGVREPQALYEAYWMDRGGASHDFSWPEYQNLLASNPAFSEAFGYRNADVRMDGRDLPGTLVTGDYFRVLGVGTALGRALLPEDSSTPGGRPVIVLSYRSWQKRFSGDPAILGKKLLLRGYPFEVVGVAAAGFSGLGSRPSEFWAPLTMAARFDAGPDLFGPEHPPSVSVVARLQAGYGRRQARASLTFWAQRLTAENPDAKKAAQAFLVSRATTKPVNLKTALTFTPIMAAFSLVLLIGCANVANLMLARSFARQREIRTRLSLGASRRRVIRQLLTESMLLALPSAAAAVAVSEATIRVCLRVLAATLPPGVAGFAARIPELHSDLRVFAFTLFVAVGAAMVFGLAPAIQATRSGPSRASRFRGMLVAGQVTTCALLLVTAGILLRGSGRVHGLDAALSSRNTIQMVVSEKSRERILSQLALEPAIEIIAAARNAPVERKPMVSVGRTDSGAASNIATNQVSPEYFALYEIPIVRGRNFTAAEARSRAPVAIISQTAAQQLWPGREALGQSMSLSAGNQTVNVIGVARDELSRWIGNGEDKGLVYFPSSAHAAGNELLIGVRGDIDAIRRKIEAGLTALGPDAIERIQKIQIREWVAEDAYYTFRVAYWLSSAVGILALLLTLSGIYGVVSYVTSQRTKEIGIRMALGATTGSVTGLMLRESLRLAMAGVAAGCLLAMGISRILGSILVMIDTFDPAAYIGGAGLVLAACAAAAYFPSRRAAGIDPLTTLRYD